MISELTLRVYSSRLSQEEVFGVLGRPASRLGPGDELADVAPGATWSMVIRGDDAPGLQGQVEALSWLLVRLARLGTLSRDLSCELVLAIEAQEQGAWHGLPSPFLSLLADAGCSLVIEGYPGDAAEGNEGDGQEEEDEAAGGVEAQLPRDQRLLDEVLWDAFERRGP